MFAGEFPYVLHVTIERAEGLLGNWNTANATSLGLTQKPSTVLMRMLIVSQLNHMVSVDSLS